MFFERTDGYPENKEMKRVYLSSALATAAPAPVIPGQILLLNLPIITINHSPREVPS